MVCFKIYLSNRKFPWENGQSLWFSQSNWMSYLRLTFLQLPFFRNSQWNGKEMRLQKVEVKNRHGIVVSVASVDSPFITSTCFGVDKVVYFACVRARSSEFTTGIPKISKSLVLHKEQRKYVPHLNKTETSQPSELYLFVCLLFYVALENILLEWWRHKFTLQWWVDLHSSLGLITR